MGDWTDIRDTGGRAAWDDSDATNEDMGDPDGLPGFDEDDQYLAWVENLMEQEPDDR